MTSAEHKQLIQNFLNCCIMETQDKPVTHEDLEKLLEFYFNSEVYCSNSIPIKFICPSALSLTALDFHLINPRSDMLAAKVMFSLY